MEINRDNINSKFCEACGASLNHDYIFCNGCGAKVRNDQVHYPPQHSQYQQPYAPVVGQFGYQENMPPSENVYYPTNIPPPKEVKIWKSVVLLVSILALLVGGMIFGLLFAFNIGPFSENADDIVITQREQDTNRTERTERAPRERVPPTPTPPPAPPPEPEPEPPFIQIDDKLYGLWVLVELDEGLDHAESLWFFERGVGITYNENAFYWFWDERAQELLTREKIGFFAFEIEICEDGTYLDIIHDIGRARYVWVSDDEPEWGHPNNFVGTWILDEQDGDHSLNPIMIFESDGTGTVDIHEHEIIWGVFGDILFIDFVDFHSPRAYLVTVTDSTFSFLYRDGSTSVYVLQR